MKRREDEILEYLEVEDLSENLQHLAELMGIEFVRQIIKEVAGLQVYVPSVSGMKTLLRRYVAAKKIDGKELVLLARDLNVSHRYIKQVIKPPLRDTAGSHPAHLRRQLVV